MEKRSEKIIRIALTGPESTAKSTLAIALAKTYQGVVVNEYARDYIQKLNRPYEFEDVEKIAARQIEEYLEAVNSGENIIFFDTWLIITKIWFREVFGKIPDWIDAAIKELPIDLYLICSPDIEWIPDPLRENGGERRTELFHNYLREIKKTGQAFYIVEGKGKDRLFNAKGAVDQFIKKQKNGEV